jgi:hypothetical protein
VNKLENEMNDSELLEAAAKAVNGGAWHPLTHDTPNGVWSPLADDGDALRLAIALRLHIDHSAGDVTAWICGVAGVTPFTEEGATPEATRRAIVRAAAAMVA